MDVRIGLAPAEDKPRMLRLADAYAAEMAAHGTGDPTRYFDAYWQERGRWPYFIRHGDPIAGFVWVNTWSPSGRGTDFAIAEFYVAPEARGAHVGCDAAVATFRTHPGQWELSVLPTNAAALAFWPKAIAAAGARRIERLEVGGWPVLRFRIT